MIQLQNAGSAINQVSSLVSCMTTIPHHSSVYIMCNHIGRSQYKSLAIASFVLPLRHIDRYPLSQLLTFVIIFVLMSFRTLAHTYIFVSSSLTFEPSFVSRYAEHEQRCHLFDPDSKEGVARDSELGCVCTDPRACRSTQLWQREDLKSELWRKSGKNQEEASGSGEVISSRYFARELRLKQIRTFQCLVRTRLASQRAAFLLFSETTGLAAVSFTSMTCELGRSQPMRRARASTIDTCFALRWWKRCCKNDNLYESDGNPTKADIGQICRRISAYTMRPDWEAQASCLSRAVLRRDTSDATAA